MSAPDRRALVDRDQREPSIRRQCTLLAGASQKLRSSRHNLGDRPFCCAPSRTF